MKRVILLGLLFVFLATSAAVALAAELGAKPRTMARLGDSKEKIQVLADRLEGSYDKQEIIFIGNVVCKQGESVLVADSLKITYKDTEPAAVSSRQLDKMEAVGAVRFFYGEKMLTGTSAIFYHDEQKLVVTGEPTMWDGRNYVLGTNIVFYLESDEGVIEGDAEQRVSAIIYPEEERRLKKDDL